MKNESFVRFYQRFYLGSYRDLDLPRLTTEASAQYFPPREEGLTILLIHAPIREWSRPNIMPLGQAYVAAAATMDGHRIEVLDLNAMREKTLATDEHTFTQWVRSKIQEKIAQVHPDVIGLGGIITQYKRIKEIATFCKELEPTLPLFLGGGIASSMPLFMLKHMPIDIVVHEEGEVTFSEVLHRLEEGLSLQGVPGCAYRENRPHGSFERIDNGKRRSLQRANNGLDWVPWPLRHAWPVKEVYRHHPIGHLNWKKQWKKEEVQSNLTKKSLSMLASRGCPYAVGACHYCYSSYLGKTYRLRSPQEVVDEMQYLYEAYEVGYLHFLDDLLLADYQWALEFFKELRKRKQDHGFEIMWGGTCRTNIIADDVVRASKQNRPHLLEQAYEVGMRQASYGIESASPKILKAIDKSGQTLEKMELAVLETQRILGYADCSFMIGSPGETQKTVEETVAFCQKVGLHPEVFFFTTAYPATAFWELALKQGLIAEAVTGKKGPADEEMIEAYFIRLGEQSNEVRTNFSDLSHEMLEDLSWWATEALGAQEVVQHPHTGEEERRKRPERLTHSLVEVK